MCEARWGVGGEATATCGASGDARDDLLTNRKSICAGRTDEELAEMKRHYYGNISTVDEKLGEILDALQARGWLENRFVGFLFGSR